MASGAGQDVRILFEHSGQPTALPPAHAPLQIEHGPSTSDDVLRQQVADLRRTVAAMQAQLGDMRNMLTTLEITPLDDAGHAIPWSDFVRRSQLSASA